jgi:2-polyprenyl-6-methoxyphenol hydroxylase-like FAD-dependent oxidoreductase
MRCAIIGGGPAGTVVGSFLAKAFPHWNIEVFERETAAQTSHPSGAGLLLQPAGLEALHKIGVAEGIMQDGQRITNLIGKNQFGWKIMDLNYQRLGEQFYGIGIQRHTMNYHFQQSLKNYPNVQVHYETPIIEIETLSRRSCHSAFYLDKVHLLSGDNHSHGPYNLVLVASGRNCTLRDKTIVVQNTVYPWGAWWAILPLNDHPNVNFEHLQQFYVDTRKMLGFLPSGKLPGKSQSYVSIFWSAMHGKEQEFKSNGLDHWKGLVKEMAPSHFHIVDQIQSIDQLIWAAYSDVRLSQLHSSSVPVAYIGDCGHSSSPQLGMGVTQACLDAYALIASLSQTSNIAQGLKVFSAMRSPTLNFYQTFSRILTPFFQSNLGLLFSLFRDISLMVPNKIYWFDKQTALTLAGYKTGLLTAQKPNFPTIKN